MVRVREATLSAYAHQEVPFERLIEDLAPERDLARPPLVQVLFSLNNAPSGALELPGLALTPSALRTGTAKFELTCAFSETEGGLAGMFEYSRDLFDGPTIERLAGHFTRLLAGAAADPRRHLPELAMLSVEEREQILVEWNDTARAFPETALHQAFERQVERHPDLPAVVSEGAVLTYGELDQRAGRLAGRLRALGVGPEVPVALYFERSASMLVAVLGVLKAGGAYLPLEPTHPSERLVGMLKGAGRLLLVSERRLEGTLTRAAAEVLWLDEIPAAEEGLRATVPVLAGNLAYVLHTSGSTGKPKGVGCTHRGVLNLLADFARRQPLAAGSRGSLWTSLSFDVSVYEIFSPLLAGGAVYIVPETIRQDPERFLDWLLAERIESAYVPPFLVAALCDRLERSAKTASLCRLLVGVEPIPEPLLARIAELCPGLAVINGYGPTEATICATLYDVDPRRSHFGDPPVTPIGRPVANSGVYLLDRHLEPVPVGVPGELYIAGAGLARGYLRRPEATAERFVPHPWSQAEGERLYRTGDLVRRRTDGNLEFLGRIDHQIKLRGFRIEPGEIEAALLAHPAVREAVVTVAGRAGFEGREHRRLVAYVAGVEGQVPASGELRELLRERLPAYMVPAAFMALPALPLTPSGKLDRKALPEPFLEEAPEKPVMPRTPAEELLAGIFAEVLKLERVGIEEDFFTLGGHSLLATRVISQVRSVFGVELPVRAIFEAPTVASLSAAIAAKSLEGRAGAPSLTRFGQAGPLPLSVGQERLWFLEQLEPGSAAYNMPVQVELSGALRRAALSTALAEVVRRHESLRTTFVAVAGTPHQRIAPPVSAFPLPLVDLSALPAPAVGSEAERLGQEQAGQGLDLERGPLFVALLVRLSAERHRFLLNLHHIVSDGWSIGVLIRELGALYPAFLEGRPSPLPELPIQYADFARWQRTWLAESQAAELAYWETRLGGEVAPVELPSDRPRPAIQTFRGGRRQVVLPPELTARLKSFGRSEGVTLFMTLLAATQALLSRHSGEHDVPVGAPIAGRRWSETEGLIGFFLNTLVLRTDLSGSPSFRELAARVRTVTLEAYSHQDVPFEAVLNRLRLDRDLSRTPLFQVLFNLLNLPARELSLPELDLQLLTPAEVPSKFDMTFYISEAESRIGFNLVYNADLFDEARMAEVLSQLETLLAQAVERPDEPVDHLSLVTRAARALLPDPAAPLDRSWIGGVHELFAEQAERAPERPAVIDGDAVWSYGDLLAGCRGLAGWLAAHGVRPGDRVAILAHRSAPMVQSVLGVLTAGAAFMVLDPAYPAPRQVEMLCLGRPRAWIALQAAGPVPGAVRSWLDEAGCPCLELPAGGVAALESLAAFCATAPRVTVGPQDVACIGFTSGSTGGPKGILGLHGPLSHFLPMHCREFELGPDDRFSLLSGLAHDPLQRDIFTPLYLGAAIVVPDPADFGIAGRWAEWMSRERVTVAHLTPALGQLLTERPPGGPGVEVPSLRRVFLVGESLTRHDVARLRAMAPGVTCINLYGSTETQRAVAFHRVAQEEAEAAPERGKQVLPLGRGMEDVQLLVIHRAGGLAAIGEIGEIAVRSPHLARGYLGNEELTSERFQLNPFTGEAGDRIYRTGDLGRYLPNGEVSFAGRSDFQVKLRGFRIELGEIEAVLTGHPAVREAVVLLRDDLPGGRGLVAYVVTEGTGEERVRSLRGWLEDRLPGYMIPAAFVPMESLPRTPNGKVDRRALERIAPEMGRGAEELVAPRTPAEELLAGIWAQVLGLERVGVEQSFFELGGHSLLATQVTSRVKDVFGVELPLRRLFATPTVAALAADLERMSGEDGPPPLVRVERRGDLPLSFAQQRLWFLEQLQPGSPVYNMPVALRLCGELSVPARRASLSEVVRRHESLRTIFILAEGQPFQRVLAPAAVPLGVIDLGELDPREREGELARLVKEHGERPFDLAAGPLLRSHLVRLGEAEHAVLLNQHHIVSDGWSTGVLVREVVTLYGAFATARPSPLPELSIQYPDFAVWQRGWLAGEVLERQVGYWRERLAGLPELLELPADRPRPVFRSGRGARHAFRLPGETLGGLKDLGRREGATDFMTLLSLFQAFLSRLSGQEELATGTVIANRGRSELEPLIGFFANTLVLRGDLSGRPSLRDVLLRTRESALEAYAHQDLPFEHLVEALQPPRATSHTPLFQVMLVLQNAPQKALSLPGLEAALIEESHQTGGARFDLTLDLAETPLGLAGSLEYATDLFDPPTVSRLAGHFATLLSEAVAAPSGSLSELPLLGAAERQQLVLEWNDTEVVRRPGERIHELFERQVVRRPGALAVAGQGMALSYAGLDAQANRLARYLRRLGVGPEARVGLCVERSPEMVVALLGILKAGAAYVSLDPAHPA
ncbi:MAG TPA: amino acid adenylation domain-containing protein [Thermoanaerobaculia bacterium]|nr:amino acid adenylation domain-containing protein [Thermoanaerobaculia bacterium]